MELLLPSRSAALLRRRRLGGLAGSLAIHVIAFVPFLPFGFRDPVESQQRGARTPAVFLAAPEVLPGPTGDTVLPDDSRARQERSSRPARDSRIGAIQIDVGRIRARRNWLFPFLTTDLLFLDRVEQEVRDSPAMFVSPMAPARPSNAGSPLLISDTALQKVIDRAWSRRERWTRFAEIARLVERHDPDRGLVPELLQAYLDQNLLQPYFDTTIRDPRFWAMLDCVADHVVFIDWVRGFARRHPSSRATTELLFLLDELAQGSRDTLLVLLATDPRDLEYTRSVNREAFDFALSLRRQYGGWLANRQLESGSAIRSHYDELRLRVLTTIIETTPAGYRAGDARFLAGEILFNRNDTAAALRMWSGIRPSARDSYVATYSEILRALEMPGGMQAAEINRILGAEFRRWLDFSAIRLRQFGYAFDTF